MSSSPRTPWRRLGVGTLAALVASLALVAVVMAGGAPGPQSAPPGGLQPIVGNWTWVQTQMNDGAIIRPSSDGEFTLNLQPGGQAAVGAGCNRGSGGWTSTGNRITIGPLATTRALCPEGSSSDRFLRDLQNAQSFLFDGTDLILELPFDSGGMRFSRTAPSAPAAQPQRSPAGNWVWVQTQMNDGAIIRPYTDGEYTLNLQAGGQAAVGAGCNRGAGGWTSQGNSINIGPLATTLALCPDGSTSQRYLQDLDRANSFLFDGNDLILELPLDSGGMRFSPAP